MPSQRGDSIETILIRLSPFKGMADDAIRIVEVLRLAACYPQCTPLRPRSRAGSVSVAGWTIEAVSVGPEAKPANTPATRCRRIDATIEAAEAIGSGTHFPPNHPLSPV
jgi:hypothetical protein